MEAVIESEIPIAIQYVELEQPIKQKYIDKIKLRINNII